MALEKHGEDATAANSVQEGIPMILRPDFNPHHMQWLRGMGANFLASHEDEVRKGVQFIFMDGRMLRELEEKKL